MTFLGNWKSTTVIKPLYDALEIYVLPERQRNVEIFGLTACAVGGFLEQVLKLGACNIPEQASKIHRIPAYAELSEIQAQEVATPQDMNHFRSMSISSSKENTNQSKHLESLLLAAAAYGQLSIVKWLSEIKGTPLECVTWRKETPLFLACCYGHLDVVDYLLDRGANAATSNDLFENCLYWISRLEPDDMDRIADRLWEAKSSLKHVVYGNAIFNPLIFQYEFLCTGYVFGSPLLRAM